MSVVQGCAAQLDKVRALSDAEKQQIEADFNIHAAVPLMHSI